MDIDKIIRGQAAKLRINHLTGNLSEMECKTFIEKLLVAIKYTRCCTEFKCGQQRVFGEEKCIKQCSDCKLDYSDI